MRGFARPPVDPRLAKKAADRNKETMARKPNYNFERKERERLKAEKKAKRALEKKEAREAKSGQSEASGQSDGQDPLAPTAE